MTDKAKTKTILKFVNDKYPLLRQGEYAYGFPIQHLYQHYELWCMRLGMNAAKLGKFQAIINLVVLKHKE